MYRETTARSLLKAVSHRLWGTLTTGLLVFLFTREFKVALAIGVLELVLKLGIFFVHERVWNRIHFGRHRVQPVVLWFTGLSASGKSTLSSRVEAELRKLKLPVEHLDGDSIRHIFPQTGFTKADRDAHIKRVGYLASQLEKHGVFVVASFISPYEESRQFVRQLCQNFIEIHVSTPLEECEKRDPKGLYAKARRGELKNFTGIDDPYEPPSQPEVVVNTSKVSLEEATRQIMARIKKYI